MNFDYKNFSWDGLAFLLGGESKYILEKDFKLIKNFF